MFSSRTPPDLTPSALVEAVARRRASGAGVIDLTVSNPTRVGLRYPADRILEALAVIQPLTMGDLAGTLLRESSRLPSGSTVVCVASLIPDALAGVLLRLHQEGQRVHVLGTSERVAEKVPAEIPMKLLGRAWEGAGAPS